MSVWVHQDESAPVASPIFHHLNISRSQVFKRGKHLCAIVTVLLDGTPCLFAKIHFTICVWASNNHFTELKIQVSHFTQICLAGWVGVTYWLLSSTSEHKAVPQSYQPLAQNLELHKCLTRCGEAVWLCAGREAPPDCRPTLSQH